MSVNALKLNMEAWIVITAWIEKFSPVQEPATVPWTTIGILGVFGNPVASLVVEEKEVELDSVTDLGMEERIVSCCVCIACCMLCDLFIQEEIGGKGSWERFKKPKL